MTKLHHPPRYRHAPVVIIGAGPAGLSAASECARHGVKTLLLDEQNSMGGQIYRSITHSPPERKKILGPDYVAGEQIAQAAQHPLIDYSPNSTLWQLSRDRQISYKHGGQSFTVHADQVILATGAMERPFPVAGWTIPGVLSGGGAQILLKSAGVVPTGSVVLAGCGPLLYLLAYQYLQANVAIKAIVDTSNRADIKAALPHLLPALRAFGYLRKGLSMIKAIKKARIPVYKGSSQIAIQGSSTVESIRFTCQGHLHTLETDLVLLHQGVIPNTQITWSLRANHYWDNEQLCWTPSSSPWGALDIPGIYTAGDSAGIGGAVAAALQGKITALEVCHQQGKLDKRTRDSLAAPLRDDLNRNLAIRPFIDALYEPKKANRIPTGDTVVCRCEAVTANDLNAYIAHGCSGPNQAKAFGRCGMGPCQGRQCGTTVTELMADALQLQASEVGYYRIRPPIKPITLAELAGNE